MWRTAFLSLVSSIGLGVALAQAAPVVKATPSTLHRGETLTLSITNPLKGVVYVTAVVQRSRVPPRDSQSPAEGPTETLVLTPDASETPTSYTSVMPRRFPFGNYDVVELKPASGDGLSLRSSEPAFSVDAAEAPTITSVDPSVIYPEKEYRLTVIGTNFSPIDAENELIFVGRARTPTCGGDIAGPCLKAETSPDGRQVTFDGIGKTLVGRQTIRVRVGRLESKEEKIALTVSKVERATPLRFAGAITIGFALLLIVSLMAVRSKTPGRPYNLLTMAFLDPDTNTYSLSKAQFYAWTLVAVFGYAFLTLSKWLVQGIFELPEVPQNLPGIILVSAGTATLATGIGSAKPKGSGAANPSLGDFVTSGGVAAPDRVQFLVWTLVGLAAFVGLLVQTEPGTVQELPKIPEGFLYLMGISSLGYLGGKLARQPGPNVTSATASHNGATAYIVDVVGKNLSPEAFLYLDDVRVLPEWLASTANANAPDIVAYEDDHRYAKQLKYSIQNVNPPAAGTKIALPSGNVNLKARLTIVNPDGQKSEYQL